MIDTMEQKQNETQLQLPNWINKDEYPFQSKSVNINGSKIHYIDEGEGQVILFAHPACAWSFIYRDMIKDLSVKYRCIVPDFPGFGFSQFDETYEFSIKSQSSFLESFIDHLQLSQILFLGHDTGGPSGFLLAAQKPSLFKGFILTDTIIYPTNEYKKLHRFLGVLGTWPMRWINKQFNLVVWAMLNNLKAHKVDSEIKRHYFNTFKSKEERDRVWKLLLSLRNSENLMNEIKFAFQSTLINKPSLLIYGDSDPVQELGVPERILNTLHDGELHLIKNEGHFPHEGCGSEIGRLVNEWILKKELATTL